MRATAFDVLAHPTYIAMNRGHGTPIDQLYDAMADLHGWIEGQQATHRRLSDLGSAQLRDSWYLGVLDLAIVRFLDDVERADDDQWAALRDYVRGLDSVVGPQVWAAVRSENRVKLWLLKNDRREQLEEFVAERWFERENRPTEIRDGPCTRCFRSSATARSECPDEQYVMQAAETPLRVTLRNVRWTDVETIELDLLARIDQVDNAGETPEVDVALVERGCGAGSRCPPRRGTTGRPMSPSRTATRATASAG